MSCQEAPIWMKILIFPFIPLILLIALIWKIIFKETCPHCHKNIWRWNKSIRKEIPFISDDNMNYPIILIWHHNCYIKSKGKLK